MAGLENKSEKLNFFQVTRLSLCLKNICSMVQMSVKGNFRLDKNIENKSAQKNLYLFIKI